MSKTRQESTNEIFKSLMVGSVAGAVEVIANHPFWTMKTRNQNKQAFTLKPTILYRGLIPNAASMMPISGIQVGLNEFLKQFYFKDEHMTDLQKTGCAFAAGAASALVACPTEMIMTQQGKTALGFIPTARWIVKQRSMKSLFCGLTATAMRDGVFTAAFIAGAPIMKSYFMQHTENNILSTIAAGMCSGMCALVLSQAADTIKTAQQSAHPKEPIGFKDAAKKIHVSSGYFGLFKGAGWRGLRIMSAVTLMSTLKEKIEARFA